MSWMRRPTRRALLWPLLPLCAWGLWTQCSAPHAPRPLPNQHAEPEKTLPRSVRVLLTDQERAEGLEVTHGGLAVSFWRQGGRVRSSRGDDLPQVQWTPAGVFSIAGRQYLGGLEVERHPEGGLRAFVRVPLEMYVEGVVAAELALWSALPAELEAQAICVRTYTVRTLQSRAADNAFLWDGVQDQAFHGMFLPADNAGERRAAGRLSQAVETTRGQILMEGQSPYDVRFHAACSGKTVDRASLFSGTSPSPAVQCVPCQERKAKETAAGQPAERRPLMWRTDFSRVQLDRLAQSLELGPRMELIAPLERLPGDRWHRVRLQGSQNAMQLPLDKLRKVLGYATWKSGVIWKLEPANGQPGPKGLTVWGFGRGHGVGLCQEGAHDYAAEGWTAMRILQHYYPGVTLERWPLGPQS